MQPFLNLHLSPVFDFVFFSTSGQLSPVEQVAVAVAIAIILVDRQAS